MVFFNLVVPLKKTNTSSLSLQLEAQRIKIKTINGKSNEIRKQTVSPTILIIKVIRQRNYAESPSKYRLAFPHHSMLSPDWKRKPFSLKARQSLTPGAGN